MSKRGNRGNSPWNHKKQPQEIPVEMIESKVKLASGATYTRLKPMYAVAAETVEEWKGYKNL